MAVWSPTIAVTLIGAVCLYIAAQTTTKRRASLRESDEGREREREREREKREKSFSLLCTNVYIMTISAPLRHLNMA